MKSLFLAAATPFLLNLGQTKSLSSLFEYSYEEQKRSSDFIHCVYGATNDMPKRTTKLNEMPQIKHTKKLNDMPSLSDEI